MAKDTLMIHDAATEEIIVRDLTDEEQAALDASRKEAIAARKKAKADAQAAYELKYGAYEKLGLTVEEINAILPKPESEDA
jgi:hypothetical protein